MQGHVALGLQNGGRSHALGAAVLDVHAAYHLVFGAACPVFGVALGAEGFFVGRPIRFAAHGKGGRLLPSDKDSKGRLANQYCTDFVPFGHGVVYEATTLESAKPRSARL